MWLKKKNQNASAVVEESLKVGWESSAPLWSSTASPSLP